MKILILCLSLLAGCATTQNSKVYGSLPTQSYIVAQICIKDPKATIEKSLRYSVLFKDNNSIRKFENNDNKINGNYFYSVPLGQLPNLTGFLLPLEYKNTQYFGFMWSVQKVNSIWTPWLEPTYTVADISDTNFKVDNGLIGKKDKDESTASPYLVRFRNMPFDEYIKAHINNWVNDPVPKCI